jgi:hypothetical protein
MTLVALSFRFRKPRIAWRLGYRKRSRMAGKRAMTKQASIRRTAGRAGRGPLIGLAVAVTWASAALAADAVSFSRDVVPILKRRCVMCHLSGREPGGLQLHPKAAWGSLVGVPSEEAPLRRVEPGRPDDSYLVRKIEGTHLDVEGSGEKMPFDGRPLAPEQVELIRRWVEQGAPDN